MAFFKCPTCRPVMILARHGDPGEPVEFCPECQGIVESSEAPEGWRRLSERFAMYDVVAWVRPSVYGDVPVREVDRFEKGTRFTYRLPSTAPGGPGGAECFVPVELLGEDGFDLEREVWDRLAEDAGAPA